jgi:hypothetical protein
MTCSLVCVYQRYGGTYASVFGVGCLENKHRIVYLHRRFVPRRLVQYVAPKWWWLPARIQDDITITVLEIRSETVKQLHNFLNPRYRLKEWAYGRWESSLMVTIYHGGGMRKLFNVVIVPSGNLLQKLIYWNCSGAHLFVICVWLSKFLTEMGPTRQIPVSETSCF